MPLLDWKLLDLAKISNADAAVPDMKSAWAGQLKIRSSSTPEMGHGCGAERPYLAGWAKAKFRKSQSNWIH